MTKTRAKKLARQARQHGHFKNEQTLYVSCPICKERVETQTDTFKTDTRCLDDAVVDHLVYDCTEGA